MTAIAIPIQVGAELAEIHRWHLSDAQAALFLRTRPSKVRARKIRGELPTASVGRRRPINALVLAEQLDAAGDHLAVRFLRAWMEGRFDVPRIERDEMPPNLMERRGWLTQPRYSSRTAPRCARRRREVRN